MSAQTRSTEPQQIVVSPPPIASRWWVVPVLLLIAVLVLCALVVAIAFLRFEQGNRAARQRLADEVQSIQDSGEPMTIEDLYAHRELPEGVADTTSLWLAALSTSNIDRMSAEGSGLPFVEVTGDEDAVFRLQPGVPDSLHDQAQAFVAAYDGTVTATLTAARAQGECRLPVEFEKGFNISLEPIQKLRGLARLFQLRLNLQKANGDIEGAMESLKVLFALPRTLNYESMLVGHLIQVALTGVAQHEAQGLLNDAALTDSQLARLEQLVRADDLQAGLTAGLVGERAMNYYVFHHLEQFQSDLPFPMVSNGKLTRPQDCLMSLELFNDWLRASREPFPDALRNAAGVDHRIRATAGSGNPLDKWTYMVTLLLTPSISTGFNSTARGLAQQRCLIAAVAAERHRRRHSSLPQRLSDLVPTCLPGVPLDPFDGQPLRLVRSPSELTIYSIGQNGIDDGGIEDGQSGDIVVRLRSMKGPIAAKGAIERASQ